MKTLKRKIKLLSKTAVGCMGFVIIIFVLSFGINIARAAWEDPSAEAPYGNIYVPLNVGPENQAKKGRLLLDPLYNPYGSSPGIDYPLEVRGPQDVYINYLEIDNNLTVDTDTLYVNGDTDQVGIGTLEPELGTKLEVVGGGVSVGSGESPVIGIGITASTSGTEYTYGIYGLSLGVDQPSIYGQGTGANSIGVYGLNTSSGYGIYAESTGASAVVGTTTAPFDTSSDIVAGIYARARGLGAWAGYFEQRLYGSDDIVGRKFVPNRLQYSQIPYTAGWELRQINGLAPTDIVFDGTYLWSANGINGTVSRIRASDGVLIGTYTIGAQVDQITFDGNYIWVDTVDGNVNRFSVQSFTEPLIIDSVASGLAANANDIAFDGTAVWATYNGVVNNLVKINASTLAVEGTYTAGTDPTMMAFDGANIWVINTTSNNISKIEVDTETVTNNIYNFGALKPTTIIYDSTYLWVGVEQPAGGNDSVFKIDPFDMTLIGSYSISLNPVSVRGVTFDGINVWVSYEDGSLSYLTRILSATGQVFESVAYGGAVKCSGASGIAFDGSHVWLSDKTCADTFSLHQFYSGSGLGLTDLAGTVTLYGTMPGTAQPGSFSGGISQTTGMRFFSEITLAPTSCCT